MTQTQDGELWRAESSWIATRSLEKARMVVQQTSTGSAFFTLLNDTNLPHVAVA